MATHFEVGDRVQGRYSGVSYTGTIDSFHSTDGIEYLEVRKDVGNTIWTCKKRDNGHWAAANGMDTGQDLKLIEKTKFKIGDYVKVISSTGFDSTRIGNFGFIHEFLTDNGVKLRMEKDEQITGRGNLRDLELIKEETRMTFEIGDRVRNRGLAESLSRNAGKLGTVKKINVYAGIIEYSVHYDDGSKGEGQAKFYELITKKKGLMKKLTTMLKKLLDADTQTLVKAGYINGDLELTETGTQALISHLFFANKADLVVLAQADLDEAEKEEAKK